MSTGNEDGEFLEQFRSGPPELAEQLRFGQVTSPWRTPHHYDGSPVPAPRRPELLGDGEDTWWADVTAWTEWAIHTFRLARWLPPCWLRHPALVEESQALWLLWCDAWMPSVDARAPNQFLQSLSLALHRIETLWQIPCRHDTHTEPTPERHTTRVRPITHDWWSLDDYDPATTAW
jgi:hypothetical protein